jgi:hypothetical protein
MMPTRQRARQLARPAVAEGRSLSYYFAMLRHTRVLVSCLAAVTLAAITAPLRGQVRVASPDGWDGDYVAVARRVRGGETWFVGANTDEQGRLRLVLAPGGGQAIRIRPAG